MNTDNWRELQNDITTDALWVSSLSTNNRPMFLIPKRDWGEIKNSSDFHGLFIPEIPYQFIRRFTNEGDYVWDCFGGSGTTKRVADMLNRKCIINDITPTQKYIIQADSMTFNPGRKFKLVIMHPPIIMLLNILTKTMTGAIRKALMIFNVVRRCVQEC